MNARYQDGKVGRFISQDPMFHDVGKDLSKYDRTLEQLLINPQELNSYSYVANNPLKYVDPTGEGLVLAAIIGLLTPNVAYAPTSDNFENPGLEAAILVGSIVAPGGGASKGVNKAVGAAVNKVDDVGETLLFRAMKEGPDGLPMVENSARGLGVRLGRDIPIDAKGFVHSADGGMSVSPNSPYNLQIHRRTPEFGGTGKDPVWCIKCSNLPSGLKYVPDSSTHGTIQPSNSMSKSKLDKLMQSTQEFWKKL